MNKQERPFFNCSTGKYFPGPPSWNVNGKSVPAFVQWNNNVAITSKILIETPATNDALNIFPRTNAVKPFLLLDGHQSRLGLPFLQYINTPCDYWVVCIGVPYGTALWQVGDSKEQNRSFDIALGKAQKN